MIPAPPPPGTAGSPSRRSDAPPGRSPACSTAPPASGTTASSCASSRETTRSGPAPSSPGPGSRETRARLADAGLAVPCVDTRSFFHSPDAAVRQPAVEEAVRSAEVAARLGARGIRVFGDRVQPGGRALPRRGAGSSSRWRDLRERLRGTGVEVWLETHGDFATAAAHPRAPRGGGGRGARRGVGPGQCLLGVRRGAGEGRGGARPLPAPRPPQGRAASADGKVPWSRCFPATATSRRTASSRG